MPNKQILYNLNNDAKLVRYTLPYAVSITKNSDDETVENIKKRQEKFLTLSEPIKDKLASDETSQKIQEIGKVYNLSLLQLSDIARAIRSFYFGEIQLKDFPQILSKEMQVDLVTAQKISNIIIEKIINDKSQEVAYKAQIATLAFSQALKQYPDIGEQLITINRIKLKNYPEPVRPSIKNWLSDYTFNLGYDPHSSMVRGNYLFQNENSRILNASDKLKLSYILKAYDENGAVSVNTATKQIIFPKTEPPKTASSSPAPVPAQAQKFGNFRPRGDYSEPKDIFEKESFATEKKENYSSPIQKIQNTPPQNPAPISPLQNKFSEQTISHTLSSNKIPDQNIPNQADDASLRFSSPQKMPFEKEAANTAPQQAPHTPHPMRITSHGLSHDYDQDSSQNKNLQGKNVVNLKDNL